MNHPYKAFGHCVSEALKITIKMYGFESSVCEFETCDECSIAKGRQKNGNKNWLSSINVPGEFLH